MKNFVIKIYWKIVSSICRFFLSRSTRPQRDFEIKEFFGFSDFAGEPIRCYQCGGNEYEDITTDVIEHIVSEQERKCKNCNFVFGYWSYGNWEY